MRKLALPAAAAVVLALGLAGCGSSDSAKQPPSGSPTPSVSPYASVPTGVTLTDPGSRLHLGQHAVVGWSPTQGSTAVLDLQVTRIERTTFDKSFQGWKISSAVAAATPYFARVVATNVSDTDLGDIAVPVWGQDDSGRLIAPQSFDKRTFEPCHPDRTPATLAPGAHVDMCFVYLISPGSDLASVTFQPQTQDHQGLEPITWSGTISTKVKPPAEPTPSSTATAGGKKGKTGKAGSSGKPGKTATGKTGGPSATGTP